MRGLEEQMDAIALTARQSALIDRWLVDNMGQRRHTVSYAVDNVRRIAYPDLPDEPVRGERHRALADHVRRRCLALGIEPKRLDAAAGEGGQDAVCTVCGRLFVSWKGAKRCKLCRLGAKRAPGDVFKEALPTRPCKQCGKPFHPRNRTHLYCSKECSKAARHDKYVVERAKKPPKPPPTYGWAECGLCGSWFERKAPNSCYCGDSCRKEAKRLWRKR